MAKRKPRKRSFRGTYRKVPVYPTQDLGTLASKDVISTVMINASTDTYRLMSTDGVWSCSGLTLGEGPVAVGIARGDYTAAEIEECLEAAGAVDLGDLLAQEKANRFVRQIAVVSAAEPLANDGKAIKTKLNWPVAEGDQPQIWAYNISAGALSTGGAHKFAGHCNIVFNP